MKRDMPSDIAFGRAAPAPETRSASPELPGLLQRVLELERERGRSHSVNFRGARTIIRIFRDCEQPVERAQALAGEPLVVELPAVIRGQVTLTYEDFLVLEIETPVESQDVNEKQQMSR